MSTASCTLKGGIRLTALPGRIIIQEDSFHYTGKLVIPEAAKRRPSTGTVIAIGEKTETVVVVGDRVLYPMYSGTGLRFRDKETQNDMVPVRVLVPEEILCKVEGDAELVEAGA